METTDIYTRLTPIFRDVLDDEDLVPSPELSAHDVPEWDSLRHIRLIVSVEKALGIKFTTPEISVLENVGQFVELIRTKLSDG